MDDNFFFDWYQKQLVDMINEGDDFTYLFGQLTGFMDYHKEWRQNCLDFAYRTITCKLCDFFWEGHDNYEILKKIAGNNPCETKGYAIWKSYIFDLTKEGEAFLLSCGVNEDTKEFSPLLKENLSALFDEHGVGFDKSCFISVID